ncbi:hypothetical protein LTR10_005848 [Elasticomyces elasticus]|nr:hypothetical protein LTR10_005848 [Elasticomyces elasticus]KAK4965053.1 hypothetical protein LTR42_012472 [Elasticomyces elasticus]
MMESELEVDVIAADGDVIFAIGMPPSKKIRVSSHILTRATSVFAALLGPKFSEGSATRDPLSPAEISLPEDDGAAMYNVCQLLHGNTIATLDYAAESEQLYKLAVVVDKYGCTERLRLQFQGLLLGY